MMPAKPPYLMKFLENVDVSSSVFKVHHRELPNGLHLFTTEGPGGAIVQHEDFNRGKAIIRTILREFYPLLRETKIEFDKSMMSGTENCLSSKLNASDLSVEFVDVQ